MADTVQVAFRLPTELVEKLDTFAAQLARQTPGTRVTRSDAARALMLRALAELGDAPKASAPPKTHPKRTRKG